MPINGEEQERERAYAVGPVSADYQSSISTLVVVAIVLTAVMMLALGALLGVVLS